MRPQVAAARSRRLDS